MAAQERMHVSPDAVALLLEALRRLRMVTASATAEVDADLTRRLRALEVTRESAASEVRRWRDRLSDCDDDDRAHVESRLADAEEALRTVDVWIARVADVLSPFKRASQGVREVIGDRLPSAIAFVEETLTLIAEYQRVAIPTAADARARATGGGVRGGSSPTRGADPGDITSLASIPLPAGLQWVSLADISRADDLRPEEGFIKVSAEDMRKGFARLRDEILPVMRDESKASTDYFREVDRARGHEYVSGVQRVYEAFFGMDHITVNKREYGDKFGVTSGRHRIHVARALGWAAVPARVL